MLEDVRDDIIGNPEFSGAWISLQAVRLYSEKMDIDAFGCFYNVQETLFITPSTRGYFDIPNTRDERQIPLCGRGFFRHLSRALGILKKIPGLGG